MKWSVLMACMLAAARAAPVAEPEAFFPLGALAIPALTGSALLDGILLGKVAFLKAALIANLILNQGGQEEEASYGAPQESYGAPQESYGAPVDSYGAPAVAYEEPAPSYAAPAPQYEEPAPSYSAPSYSAPSYSAPANTDSYGAPAAAPVDTYGSPAAAPASYLPPRY